jgi:hypothetical protein
LEAGFAARVDINDAELNKWGGNTGDAQDFETEQWGGKFTCRICEVPKTDSYMIQLIQRQLSEKRSSGPSLDGILGCIALGQGPF